MAGDLLFWKSLSEKLLDTFRSCKVLSVDEM
jgi:hypothetical protein